MSTFVRAKTILPDGRVGLDAVKLASIETEGIFLTDYPKHLIRVRTQNTLYAFATRGGKTTGLATKPDGSEPRYLSFETEVSIHGSTWGGSMLKVGYIGVGMYLAFSIGDKTVITSRIEQIQVSDA